MKIFSSTETLVGFWFPQPTGQSWIILFNLILDPPTVRLEIGKAINLEDLEEGDDVYFECSVEANPPPYKVTWLHNVNTFLIHISNI